MWHTFWLVLIDLWYFFCEEIGWRVPVTHESMAMPSGLASALPVSLVPRLAAATAPVLIPATTYAVSTVQVPPTTPTAHHIVPVSPIVPVSRFSVATQTYYVESISGAMVLRTPHMAYDNGLRQLSYGTPMTVRGFYDAYADVVVQGTTGYISKDAITPHRSDVWPLFVPGERYDASVKATVQTRHIIADTYLCGRMGIPLQSSEYLTLRLQQDNIQLPWRTTKPRIPGQWHTLLRGSIGVHSSVVPKTDAIMEWEGEDGVGRLAYVEAVLPDAAIRVSAIGMVEVGEYTESLIPATVWREWRPVFISIS